MECKGRRTMKRCFHVKPEKPTSTTSFFSPLVGTFLISLLRRSLSQHYSRPVEFPGGKNSSGSSPRIRMAKPRKVFKKKEDKAKCGVGRCMGAVVDGGGNESQVFCLGPR